MRVHSVYSPDTNVLRENLNTHTVKHLANNNNDTDTNCEWIQRNNTNDELNAKKKTKQHKNIPAVAESQVSLSLSFATTRSTFLSRQHVASCLDLLLSKFAFFPENHK